MVVVVVVEVLVVDCVDVVLCVVEADVTSVNLVCSVIATLDLVTSSTTMGFAIVIVWLLIFKFEFEEIFATALITVLSVVVSLVPPVKLTSLTKLVTTDDDDDVRDVVFSCDCTTSIKLPATTVLLFVMASPGVSKTRLLETSSSAANDKKVHSEATKQQHTIIDFIIFMVDFFFIGYKYSGRFGPCQFSTLKIRIMARLFQDFPILNVSTGLKFAFVTCYHAFYVVSSGLKLTEKSGYTVLLKSENFYSRR